MTNRQNKMAAVAGPTKNSEKLPVEKNAEDSHATKTGSEGVKLIVLGKESHFSDEIMAYALEMAQRMNFEIIALNTAPLSCSTLDYFSSSGKKICDDFKDLSQKNAAPFKSASEMVGVPFTHLVKFVGNDAALEEVHREYGEIGFVVSEPETKRRQPAMPASGRSREPGILVYSMH